MVVFVFVSIYLSFLHFVLLLKAQLRVNIYRESTFGSSNSASGIKQKKSCFELKETLSNSSGKMSRSRNLNPDKIAIAEEKYETSSGNMGKRRSLPAANVPTLERLQNKDPTQGIENYLCSIYSNPEVGNSFDGIT